MTPTPRTVAILGLLAAVPPIWEVSNEASPAPPQPPRPPIIPPAAGRNDRCPCGSGAKYKRCHRGKPIEPPKEEPTP